jgi:hypothetical protein
MLHKIEYLEIAENPITFIDAVMQAIGNRAMPETREEVEVDTQDQSSVSLHSADDNTTA